MKKLDAVQRKGLSICLGLPATSGREAMEVEGNILTVDLRIEEIAVREIAKIQSKNIAEPVVVYRSSETSTNQSDVII